jgi:hypothetical protein
VCSAGQYVRLKQAQGVSSACKVSQHASQEASQQQVGYLAAYARSALRSPGLPWQGKLVDTHSSCS